MNHKLPQYLVSSMLIGFLVGCDVTQRDDTTTKVHATQSRLTQLETAITLLLKDCDMKNDELIINALVSDPGEQCWNGPYVNVDISQDYWGQRIVVRRNGTVVELKSNGPDGEPETGDDISSTFSISP